MRLAVIGLSLVVSNGSAMEFRGLSFGQSCSDIFAAEKVLGASQIESYFDDAIIFAGRFYDAPAVISYKCKEDRLIDQSILVKLESEQRAENLFIRISADLIDTLGEPHRDLKALEALAQAKGADVGISEGNSLMWKFEDHYLHLMYSPFGPNTWSVSLSQSNHRPVVYIMDSNQSVEEDVLPHAPHR